jgi:hypothetical protein
MIKVFFLFLAIGMVGMGGQDETNTMDWNNRGMCVWWGERGVKIKCCQISRRDVDVAFRLIVLCLFEV